MSSSVSAELICTQLIMRGYKEGGQGIPPSNFFKSNITKINKNMPQTTPPPFANSNNRLLRHSNANLRHGSFSMMNHSASRPSESYVNSLIDDSSNAPPTSSAPSEEIRLNQSIRNLI